MRLRQCRGSAIMQILFSLQGGGVQNIIYIEERPLNLDLSFCLRSLHVYVIRLLTYEVLRVTSVNRNDYISATAGVLQGIICQRRLHRVVNRFIRKSDVTGVFKISIGTNVFYSQIYIHRFYNTRVFFVFVTGRNVAFSVPLFWQTIEIRWFGGMSWRPDCTNFSLRLVCCIWENLFATQLLPACVFDKRREVLSIAVFYSPKRVFMTTNPNWAHSLCAGLSVKQMYINVFISQASIVCIFSAQNYFISKFVCIKVSVAFIISCP